MGCLELTDFIRFVHWTVKKTEQWCKNKYFKGGINYSHRFVCLCLSSFHVPINYCNQYALLWVERRQWSAQNGAIEMASGIYLEIAEDLQQIQDGRFSQTATFCYSHCSSIIPASLVTVEQANRNIVEEEGGCRQEKLFPTSAHLYFLLIGNCSGRIISGAHTAAWTPEVVAVTCPHSGLVHRWQLFGKTEDPTETCVGSSYFVLPLCLDLLWFVSPFQDSHQTITILWCIIIWRFWEEFKSFIH